MLGEGKLYQEGYMFIKTTLQENVEVLSGSPSVKTFMHGVPSGNTCSPIDFSPRSCGERSVNLHPTQIRSKVGKTGASSLMSTASHG